MLCDNCKTNDATVRYTEIINGEKKEMHLCEECSHKLGIDNLSFNMPIDFSSFFGGLLDDEFETPEFKPLFSSLKELKCDNCNMTYDEFTKDGKFGCEECYNVFSNKIDSLLKRLHGSSKYMGRKALNSSVSINNDIKKEEKEETKKEETKLQKLQNDLKKAIADERYEDAAKLRDEIKKIEK